MRTTVLIPIDFSADDDLVLSLAAGLPALGVRRVMLANVVEASGTEGPVIASTVDEVRERLRGYVSGLEAAGLSVEIRVPTGDAFEELAALSRESHIDSVVCGSHAKSIVATFFEGSVSERMLRDADVPVLSVRYDLLRGQANPAALIKRFGEKLVLPTDFSLSASRAFTRILELPKGSVKHLLLSHVIDPGLSGERLRKAEEGAEFHLKNMQAMAVQHGMQSSMSIRHGNPVQAILSELDDWRATGVVTGSRGRNAVQEMLLGSTSMTLLRQASCPVMVVH
jgi:nucleotide-binding universal stress UspA family protein